MQLFSKPKQKKVVGQLPDIFGDYIVTKIYPLRVLVINGRASSWQIDALKCVRIFTLLVKTNTVSKRLIPLLSKWADRLLYYASAFGLGEEFQGRVGGKISWAEQNNWLYNYLQDIKSCRSAESIYDRRFSFYIKDYSVAGNKCSLTGKENVKLVRYETKFDDGSTIKSDPVDINAIKYLEERIKAGLDKHSNIDKRLVILNKIRKLRCQNK